MNKHTRISYAELLSSPMIPDTIVERKEFGTYYWNTMPYLSQTMYSHIPSQLQQQTPPSPSQHQHQQQIIQQHTHHQQQHHQHQHQHQQQCQSQQQLQPQQQPHHHHRQQQQQLQQQQNQQQQPPTPQPTPRTRGRRVSNIPNHGVRMFACKTEGCGKVFKRSEHLKRHVRSIHTMEKPFKCPYISCNKRFSRSDNLNQHIRIHRHCTNNNKSSPSSTSTVTFHSNPLYPL